VCALIPLIQGFDSTEDIIDFTNGEVNAGRFEDNPEINWTANRFVGIESPFPSTVATSVRIQRAKPNTKMKASGRGGTLLLDTGEEASLRGGFSFERLDHFVIEMNGERARRDHVFQLDCRVQHPGRLFPALRI